MSKYSKLKMVHDFIESESELSQWMKDQGWPSVEEIHANNKVLLEQAEKEAKRWYINV